MGFEVISRRRPRPLTIGERPGSAAAFVEGRRAVRRWFEFGGSGGVAGKEERDRRGGEVSEAVTVAIDAIEVYRNGLGIRLGCSDGNAYNADSD